MTNPSPDLIPQVEAESVDTPEFREMFRYMLRSEYALLVSKLDSMITARVAAARQEGRRDTHEEKVVLMLESAKLEDALAASQAVPAKAEGIPEVLFDGNEVYAEITRKLGKSHCHSADTVSATLDAVVRLMRRAAPSTPAKEPT